MKRRSAFSSSVGRNCAFSSGCSGITNSPGNSFYPSGNSSHFPGCSASTGKSNVRTPALGGRSPQSSLDSSDVGQVLIFLLDLNDIGQISMNLMRVNGAIAPFKALLTNLTGPSDPSSPAAPIKVGRSASSQYLSSSVSPKRLHKIGSHYVLENVNRKDGSTTRLFDAPIVNIES
ncbi:unnamed protein product [Acanthocheilonema viteae]|uniref:Uncharacterized protein n=1 Tax=Acanthocheilonema viteae TaxID=6277 RepID=A0A498S6I9_ACAVI|nr:unnamed protein product [Acanthocheilonema viteae]